MREKLEAGQEYNETGDGFPFWNTQTLQGCWGKPGENSFFDDATKKLGLNEQESKIVYDNSLRVLSIFIFAGIDIRKDFRVAFLPVTWINGRISFHDNQWTDSYLPFDDGKLNNIVFFKKWRK